LAYFVLIKGLFHPKQLSFKPVVKTKSLPRKVLNVDYANNIDDQVGHRQLQDHNDLFYRIFFRRHNMKPSAQIMDENHLNIHEKIVSFKKISDSYYRRAGAKFPPGFSKIITRNRKMKDVFRQMAKVAEYDYAVHIFGETGTGKELVAEAIHNAGPRRNGPFVPINCGALPENLVESELFGHVKGSFSGAIRDRKGRFELADNGTIFLDEVAELSKYMQAKLLRFLQDGKFERVGGEKTISVNARVISATNKDLKNEMKKNIFRDDLYYRINVVPVHLPPLRERKSDIPLLADHFLKQAIRQYNRSPVAVSDKAMALLLEYPWPGNIRELQNAVQYSFVKSNGIEITPDDLPMEIGRSRFFMNRSGASRKLNVERVEFAMEKTGGNKAKAARLLKVGRATLYRFFNEHPHLRESFCT
jgi:sigma-54 dependent transcriptional regulator, acetoin dehydrogenase operon transcriptional activator AcoR